MFMQHRREFHNIGADLSPGHIEAACQIPNDTVERLLFLHHLPYPAADRIDAEAQTLLDIKPYGGVPGFAVRD